MYTARLRTPPATARRTRAGKRMFEKCSESARRSIFFARYEADKMMCREIAPEHLLLGVAREGKSLDEWFGLKGRVDAIRSKIQPRNRALLRFSKNLPLSEGSKRVMAFALEEAEDLHHAWICPEHLLLGLFRENDPVARELLESCEIDQEALKQKVSVSEQSAMGLAPEERPARFVLYIPAWLKCVAVGGWILAVFFALLYLQNR
jgi:ATP-dependent Clp protease ATP-binding subunit ClpC